MIYRAAMESPLLREVKVCSTLADINPLILRLQGVATRVVLFRSVATGDDTHESDIDLLIETADAKAAAERVALFRKPERRSRIFEQNLDEPDGLLPQIGQAFQRYSELSPVCQNMVFLGIIGPETRRTMQGRRLQPLSQGMQ